MNTDEAIELLGSLNEKIGVTEEIENVVAALADVGQFLSGVKETEDRLQKELADANEKAMQLRRANNDLYRQLNVQEERVKNAQQELSSVDLIEQLI